MPIKITILIQMSWNLVFRSPSRWLIELHKKKWKSSSIWYSLFFRGCLFTVFTFSYSNSKFQSHYSFPPLRYSWTFSLSIRLRFTEINYFKTFCEYEMRCCFFTFFFTIFRFPLSWSLLLHYLTIKFIFQGSLIIVLLSRGADRTIKNKGINITSSFLYFY